MFVMLLLTVITQIPQLNLAKLFSLEMESTDPERQLLADSSNNSTSYTRQIDEEEFPGNSSQAQSANNLEVASNKY
jgi:hypothetical protein